MPNVNMVESANAAAVADWLEQRLARALSETEGSVAITVPGGSTPFPIFEELVQRELDFARLLVWPGDDRIVPEDHPASNTGKIRALFEQVGAEVVTLTEMEQVPHFAIAWLGMGADGHIASLFPNTDPKSDDPLAMRRLTPDPLPPEAPFDRITLTMPSLLASDEILFTLGGSAEKRELFEAAARDENDLPIARFLAASRQPVTCFA
ncbi:6-phosphogluconolactonase [Altererythrobacter arenosus]|uniref:6-phosphogluconolactonase n=1 Tax=Altererythrobacter arenosus TaxID=3032592 RepID=A0ABY8FPL4_9SPHN|nr:6-phosphogluconolactonase [Altererythrobacter sp. CAU 1644]WFL76210.1 6-phosphogluconolactonase [Altererythrobacter sp. CAU 1644]